MGIYYSYLFNLKKFLEQGPRTRSSSLGELDEAIKKKREEVTEETPNSPALKRSSKLIRTPTKPVLNKSSMEEILKRFDVLTEIQKELKAIQKSNEMIRETLQGKNGKRK